MHLGHAHHGSGDDGLLVWGAAPRHRAAGAVGGGGVRDHGALLLPDGGPWWGRGGSGLRVPPMLGSKVRGMVQRLFR